MKEELSIKDRRMKDEWRGVTNELGRRVKNENGKGSTSVIWKIAVSVFFVFEVKGEICHKWEKKVMDEVEESVKNKVEGRQ